MVKHVILWQLKDELSAEEKAAVKAGIKEGLESLSGKIPGLVDIHVNIDALFQRRPDAGHHLYRCSRPQGLLHPPGTCGSGKQQGASLLQKPRLSGLRGVRQQGRRMIQAALRVCSGLFQRNSDLIISISRSVCGRSGMPFYGMNLRKKGHCTICAMTLLLSGDAELTERTPRCTQSRTLPAAS